MWQFSSLSAICARNDACGQVALEWVKMCHMGRFDDTKDRHDSIQIGRQGRIVIPASVREELDMRPGTDLIYRIENGCLVLETRRNVMRRLQARFSHVPKGVSLADELIADRRHEAASDEPASV